MTKPEEEPVWNLYTFDEPQQVEASIINGEPVYFECCVCGEEDAVLVGYMATKQDPSRKELAYRTDAKTKTRRPAFFCQKCWDQLLADSET